MEENHSTEVEKSSYMKVAKMLKLDYDPEWFAQYEADVQAQVESEKRIAAEFEQKQADQLKNLSIPPAGKLRRAKSAKAKYGRLSRVGSARSKRK